jgi:hypothetical protein
VEGKIMLFKLYVSLIFCGPSLYLFFWVADQWGVISENVCDKGAAVGMAIFAVGCVTGFFFFRQEEKRPILGTPPKWHGLKIWFNWGCKWALVSIVVMIVILTSIHGLTNGFWYYIGIGAAFLGILSSLILLIGAYI